MEGYKFQSKAKYVARRGWRPLRQADLRHLENDASRMGMLRGLCKCFPVETLGGPSMRLGL
jgi:hypothetical protein